jgi:hypothetical protein
MFDFTALRSPWLAGVSASVLMVIVMFIEGLLMGRRERRGKSKSNDQEERSSSVARYSGVEYTKFGLYSFFIVFIVQFLAQQETVINIMKDPY